MPGLSIPQVMLQDAHCLDLIRALIVLPLETYGCFYATWQRVCESLSMFTGDGSFHHRLEYIIEELSKVQKAFGDGYLSAFPKEHFTRLQSLEPVWAPFYVVYQSLLIPVR